MRHREMVVAGLGLVTLMHVIFFATGFERGPIYSALQMMGILGAGAALAIVWMRPSRAPLALGIVMATLGLVRLLHIVLDLSRLPAWQNWGLFAAYALGAAQAFRWAYAAGSAESGARGVRAAAWLLGALHFFGAVTALSGGRLPGILGLAAGTVGFFLLAPNVEAAPHTARGALPGGGSE